jgi:outer membrane protein assembly factor BamB
MNGQTLNEPMPDDLEIAPAAVRPSRWRLVLAIATVLGTSLYFFGQIAARDDEGRFPSMAVIMTIMLGPMLSLLGFAGYWVLFGDGRWYHRILEVLGCVVVTAVATIASHKTVQPFVVMWGLPLTVAVTGLVLAVIPSLRWRRDLGIVLAIGALTPWCLIRMNGTDGKYQPQLSLRWKSTSDEIADANLSGKATSLPTEVIAVSEAVPVTAEDWPGFRGMQRTSEVASIAVQGWKGGEPRLIWKHEAGKVGPAWSSFCVVGNALYTQEQRGNSESVVCYRADTGAEVWARGEESLHFDQPSESGPRATPTYAKGLIYAESATGVVSCLRADTGEPVWSVDLTKVFDATKPMYGFSTSPLAVGDLIVINPASTASPQLVALDAKTGKTRWQAERLGSDGYSSPHLATIQGVEQVLVFNANGLFGHDPASGKELWHFEWKVKQMEPTSVQPLVTPDGRVVVGGGNIGMGIRCAKVTKAGDAWKATELWKTTKFTPYFNDMVRVGDYLYGLDGGILSCLKLADGQRVWKDGRYGSGQLLLLGDKLLVVGESGQVACVAANPVEYEELWKIDAVNGKTWNHPAIAHGRLFVRNRHEMAAFDLVSK